MALRQRTDAEPNTNPEIYWFSRRSDRHTSLTRGAMCVQRFDDSQCSAIHTTFRALLRSSSMREPRDPLLKVLTFIFTDNKDLMKHKGGASRRRSTSCVHSGLRVRRSRMTIH